MADLTADMSADLTPDFAADIKIGILHSGTKGNHDAEIAALTNSIIATVSQPNFNISATRFAGLDPTKLNSQAQNLVSKVDYLVAAGGTASALAALNAANALLVPTVKIVFTSVTDPQGSGLVQNLGAPEGIITGICAQTSELDPARLTLLASLPNIQTIGVLTNSTRAGIQGQITKLKAAAAALHPPVALTFQDVPSTANQSAKQYDKQISQSFTNLMSPPVTNPPTPPADAILITADPVFNDRRVAALANKLQIPAIYQWREFAAEGGLMSYGVNLKLAYTLAGIYVGRLVNGSTIAQLPVFTMQSSELILNLTTASSIPVTIPDKLLNQVTEVIV